MAAVRQRKRAMVEDLKKLTFRFQPCSNYMAAFDPLARWTGTKSLAAFKSRGLRNCAKRQPSAPFWQNSPPG